MKKKPSIYKIIRAILLIPFLPVVCACVLLSGDEGYFEFYYGIY